ncbi:glycoside hydrolase [Antribacter gilvus]|uniref:glycoside hydrolase n=1 Tax=Antribacter gilvus TaxID=2304675 RepID=UPI000F7A3062|nr:glycoside hydrolase [Antribacter gilvus]
MTRSRVRSPQVSKTISTLAAFGVVLAGSTAAWASDSTAKAPETRPTAVVDWDDERQDVDGFGGSFAFHKAGSIQRLGEPQSSEMLDMIFDDEAGIGLDIVRVMVGDGGIGTWGDQLYDGPTHTIEPEPGAFVWDQPNWEEVKPTFDHYQVWLMREAQARGVDTILASAWSPPAWMKENSSVRRTADGLPNRLRTDMYDEFADYLAEYVIGYEREFGIRISHVSPTNEPDLSTSYSSSQWTPEELRVFVRDHLGPTFAERGVDAEIVLGEAVRFDESFVLPAVTDPEANQYVDVVAAHGYAGLVDGATRAAPGAFATSQQLGTPIWQTEYMNQGSPRDRLFVNNTMTDGLRYAELIGNLFNETQISAYFWWWPVANNGADGSDLIRLVNTGTPQSGNPTETGEYRIFKRYYTVGQYSRFVDPGDVLLGATPQPAPGVTLTAFKDPETGEFAVVLVNENAHDVTLDLALEGGFPLPDRRPALAAYRTSASENLVRLDDVRVHDAGVTTTLRAGSVTTFVPAEGALPGLPDRKDVFSTYPAEENDGTSPGVRTTPVTDRGLVATGVRDGAWLRWANVNFADGSAAGFADQKGELRLHADVRSTSSTPTILEVRIDDPVHGAVVGTLEVPPGTGEWTTATTWVDTSPDGGAYGFHDLYLVAQGDPAGAAHASLLDLDYATFSD